MGRRRNTNFLDEERETKKMLYIAGSILVIAILAFIITFIVYSNTFNSDEIKTGDTGILEIMNGTTSASTQIGKSINEVEAQNNIESNSTNVQNENSVSENTIKVAINTSNMQKESVNANKTENVSTTTNTTSNTISTEKVTQNKKELKFVKPVEGEIVKEFAKDKLVYSDTLKEWVIHNGIDIKADKTTIVKASEEGTIKSIKNDPRYGITVVVEHEDGYKTIYSNLLTAEFVSEGEKVKKEQTLGTVGNTATFEIVDEPHLHFEMLKDDEYINPEQYIK